MNQRHHLAAVLGLAALVVALIWLQPVTGTARWSGICAPMAALGAPGLIAEMLPTDIPSNDSPWANGYQAENLAGTDDHSSADRDGEEQDRLPADPGEPGAGEPPAAVAAAPRSPEPGPDSPSLGTTAGADGDNGWSGPGGGGLTVPSERAEDVRQAAEAYRGYLNAYGTHDSDGYFGTYAPTLACYYARQGMTGSGIRETSRGRHFSERGSARLQTVQLTAVGVLGVGIVFVDDGLVVSSRGSNPYRKVIRMIETTNGWRIDTEVDVNQRGCRLDFTDFAIPTLEEIAHGTFLPTRWVEAPSDCWVVSYGWSSPRFEDEEPETQAPSVVDAPPAPCSATRQSVSCSQLDPGSNGECILTFDSDDRLLQYEFTMGHGSAPWTTVWSYHR